MSKVPVERETRQKRAIRDVFERSERPLSTEEVLVAAHDEVDGIGIATIYRSIRTLLEDGWLTAVDVPGRAPVYERSGKTHHHHFICLRCERVYELAGCSSEVKGNLPRGFRATGHDVTIHGTCAACSKPPRPKNR